MKSVLPILSICFMISCLNTKPKKNNTYELEKSKDIYNLNWIVGSWIRTNNNLGERTYEHWQVLPNLSYSGKTYTLSDSDTIFKELITIKKSQEGRVY